MRGRAHDPPGGPSARRWLCRPSASHRTHHLHLVAERDELRRHPRFRDALRADALLAADYAALKRELGQRMPNDREGYTAAKTTSSGTLSPATVAGDAMKRGSQDERC